MWYTMLNGLVCAAAAPWVKTSAVPLKKNQLGVACTVPKDTAVCVYRPCTSLLPVVLWWQDLIEQCPKLVGFSLKFQLCNKIE